MAYDFDTIARDYDRMNHLMTLGLDRWWRRRAVRELRNSGPESRTVLDMACGTGDLSLELRKRGYRVTGADLSTEMLAIARQKVEGGKWMVADAEHLPFADGEFDAVCCAFGVRNFVHLDQGLAEMRRVLRPGGVMAILELSTPDNGRVRWLYNIYARRIIPMLGAIIAGNRGAYTYLPRSIEVFPKGEDFMRRLGMAAVQRKQTFGVCRLYVAKKEEATR